MADNNLCTECGAEFDPTQSIDNELCDDCRMISSPCLECGAKDEYQAQEMCLCGGDKDHCHGVQLWG